MMNESARQFWEAIQYSIEKYYPNVGGMIHDFIEDEDCQGFILKSYNDQVVIQPFGIFQEAYMDTLDVNMLQYLDPPGTFEGIDENANM